MRSIIISAMWGLASTAYASDITNEEISVSAIQAAAENAPESSAILRHDYFSLDIDGIFIGDNSEVNGDAEYLLIIEVDGDHMGKHRFLVDDDLLQNVRDNQHIKISRPILGGRPIYDQRLTIEFKLVELDVGGADKTTKSLLSRVSSRFLDNATGVPILSDTVTSVLGEFLGLRSDDDILINHEVQFKVARTLREYRALKDQQFTMLANSTFYVFGEEVPIAEGVPLNRVVKVFQSLTGRDNNIEAAHSDRSYIRIRMTRDSTGSLKTKKFYSVYIEVVKQQNKVAPTQEFLKQIDIYSDAIEDDDTLSSSDRKAQRMMINLFKAYYTLKEIDRPRHRQTVRELDRLKRLYLAIFDPLYSDAERSQQQEVSIAANKSSNSPIDYLDTRQYNTFRTYVTQIAAFLDDALDPETGEFSARVKNDAILEAWIAFALRGRQPPGSQTLNGGLSQLDFDREIY